MCSSDLLQEAQADQIEWALGTYDPRCDVAEEEGITEEDAAALILDRLAFRAQCLALAPSSTPADMPKMASSDGGPGGDAGPGGAPRTPPQDAVAS